LFKNLMEHMGVEADRLHFSWISSAESTKFVKVVKRNHRKGQSLGPNQHFVKIGEGGITMTGYTEKSGKSPVACSRNARGNGHRLPQRFHAHDERTVLCIRSPSRPISWCGTAIAASTWPTT
jgi:hypothetical protein